MVDVEVLVVEGCPNGDAAIGVVGRVARRLGVTPRVTIVEITDLASARQRGFVGSPTIRVNGRDVTPATGGPASLSCRIYRTPHGFAGVPDDDAVRDALAATGPERGGAL